MRTTLCLSAFLLAVALASARDVTQYSIEDFINTTNVSGASFSPDGSKILVTSDATDIFNAYAIPADGSAPIQLTNSAAHSIFAESYFPRDERIAYRADEGGNELDHVYVREVDGTVKDITPGAGLKADFLDWSEDKKSFFITSNERDKRYFDLYEVQADGYARELIFQNDEGLNVVDVSPNKDLLALIKIETNKKSDVYIHDRAAKKTTMLSHHQGEVVCQPQQFSKDGKTLYCLTDKESEFLYLVKENLTTGAQEVTEQPNWDVMYAGLSESGRYRVVAVNEDAHTRLRIFDYQASKYIELPAVPGAGVSSVRFSNDDSAVAFYVHGAQSPGDLYYYKLASSDAPRKLTSRLNPKINPDDLVEPEVARFKSYDGVEVPGILYKPHQAEGGAKLPALVYVHGGPGGQTRINYDALAQFLVNHGYVVYGINNRGSSGYGKTFFAMDDLKHGEDDLDDCVASKKMLIDTGYVDPKRIGIIGGSYGGYMVCAALAFRPQEFEVGVDIFGVTNWYRTLKSIPPWWESQRKALYLELGDPIAQEEYVKKISPLFHAENIVKPMIVLQGKNDPRVLKVESDEMVAAVRKNGVPVEYVVFDDEGHGFRKKENIITGYKAVLKFLDEHLKGA